MINSTFNRRPLGKRECRTRYDEDYVYRGLLKDGVAGVRGSSRIIGGEVWTASEQSL